MTTIQATSHVPQEPPTRLESWLVRYRVHVGFLLVAGILTEGVLRKETPRDLFHLTWWVGMALPLVFAGAAIRLISMGTIRKNETLATRGIYSLCRHPLYLGSALLFVGLGILLNDSHHEFWYLGVPYILIFYSAAIRKEERFLREKFGQQFDEFKRTTPALIPFGHFQKGEFSLSRAFQKGGIKLLVTVAFMLAAMQAMVYIFPMI